MRSSYTGGMRVTEPIVRRLRAGGEAEGPFSGAQFRPQKPNQLTSPRRRDQAPFVKGSFGARDFGGNAGGIVGVHPP